MFPTSPRNWGARLSPALPHKSITDFLGCIFPAETSFLPVILHLTTLRKSTLMTLHCELCDTFVRPNCFLQLATLGWI